jgi:hypothetical protein
MRAVCMAEHRRFPGADDRGILSDWPAHLIEDILVGTYFPGAVSHCPACYGSFFFRRDVETTSLKHVHTIGLVVACAAR